MVSPHEKAVQTFARRHSAEYLEADAKKGVKNNFYAVPGGHGVELAEVARAAVAPTTAAPVGTTAGTASAAHAVA